MSPFEAINKQKDISFSLITWFHKSRLSTLCKLINKVTVFPMKIQAWLIANMNKLILNIYTVFKGIRKAKTILKTIFYLLLCMYGLFYTFKKLKEIKIEIIIELERG